MSRRFVVRTACVALAGAVLLPRGSTAEETREPTTVIAASSSRPGDCAEAPSLWRRAVRSRGTAFCDLLLLAGARLGEAPVKAQAAAEQAARVAPARPEPWVLMGRALVLLGDFELAAQRFAEAEKRDSRALASPVDLLAAARADARTHAYASALARYRRLIPRARFLADHRERQRALLEAALVAQLVSPELSAEARAYATEVRRQDEIFYGDLSRAVLALVLDREGRHDEARSLARETDGPWLLSWLLSRESDPRGRRGELTPVWPPAEREALLAVLTEPVDEELGREAWRDYLRAAGRDAPAHVIDHARRRSGGLPDDEED